MGIAHAPGMGINTTTASQSINTRCGSATSVPPPPHTLILCTPLLRCRILLRNIMPRTTPIYLHPFLHRGQHCIAVRKRSIQFQGGSTSSATEARPSSTASPSCCRSSLSCCTSFAAATAGDGTAAGWAGSAGAGPIGVFFYSLQSFPVAVPAPGQPLADAGDHLLAVDTSATTKHH